METTALEREHSFPIGTRNALINMWIRRREWYFQSPPSNHKGSFVRFRDRDVAQEEQVSNFSSSSKSYEDFLSFATMPAIHGEGRTLSEELSILTLDC